MNYSNRCLPFQSNYSLNLTLESNQFSTRLAGVLPSKRRRPFYVDGPWTEGAWTEGP